MALPRGWLLQAAAPSFALLPASRAAAGCEGEEQGLKSVQNIDLFCYAVVPGFKVRAGMKLRLTTKEGVCGIAIITTE